MRIIVIILSKPDNSISFLAHICTNVISSRTSTCINWLIIFTLTFFSLKKKHHSRNIPSRITRINHKFEKFQQWLLERRWLDSSVPGRIVIQAGNLSRLNKESRKRHSRLIGIINRAVSLSIFSASSGVRSKGTRHRDIRGSQLNSAGFVVLWILPRKSSIFISFVGISVNIPLEWVDLYTLKMYAATRCIMKGFKEFLWFISAGIYIDKCFKIGKKCKFFI